MLKSISWQEYFYFVGLIVIGYYTISILLLYSKETILKFNSFKADPPKQDFSQGFSENLMGRIHDEPIVKESSHDRIVPSEEISISSADEGQSNEKSSDALMVGAVSDLLQEIKTISTSISQSSGTKTEATFMFQSLLKNYSHLSSTKYQEAINVFLFEECKTNCQFQIELTDVRTWWPSES